MQMYRVKFAIPIEGDQVDLGDCVVCAQSRENAAELMIMWLGLPRSTVELEVERMKPSLYQISRRVVTNSINTVTAETVNAAHASSATFPGVTETQTERHWHSVVAAAQIKAENENEAIVMLSRAIAREMSGEQQKRSCQDLTIQCDRAEFHPRSPAVEQNALFKEHRIFKGGDGRT